MSAHPALMAELRLLRAMGEAGRTAAADALRSARLGEPAVDPMKLMTRRLDAAIVKGGGKSIYACKPRGDMSNREHKRFARWAADTPRVHPDAGGPKPRPQVPPRQTSDKPGRVVAGLTGKLGGYVSDRDDER